MGPHVYEKTLMNTAIEKELREQCTVAKDMNNNITCCPRISVDNLNNEKPKESKKAIRILQSKPKLQRQKSRSLTEITKALSLLKVEEQHPPLRRYNSFNLDGNETHVDDLDGLLTTSLCSTEL